MPYRPSTSTSRGRRRPQCTWSTPRAKITITGSETYYDADGGFVVVQPNGTPVAGFLNRVYTYDQRLDDFPPPKYPVIQDGTLKVNTWIEDTNPT